MMAPRLEPSIEGPSEAHTLFFVQGWPDDRTLWDEQVEALRDRYRCVRVDMPNYGAGDRRRWGYDHDAIVEGLATCIREISPDSPVTLIAHDWGAYWGYRLHHHHPKLVARMVALDVGADIRPTPRELMMIAAYQWWLATAFVVGGPVGDWMTRRMARIADAPRQGEELSSAINYPYLYTWRDLLTGRDRESIRGYSPEVPLMFVYGADKPGRFHSDRWLETVRSRPGNRVVALDAGHWVTRDPGFTELLCDWLESTDRASTPSARG